MMERWKGVAMGIVGLVLLVGLVSLEPGRAAAADGANAWDHYQQCKIDCNESYGGLDVFPPSVGDGAAQGWSQCVLKCEREYWKKFDREMGLGPK
jgi:hypothetical protein